VYINLIEIIIRKYLIENTLLFLLMAGLFIDVLKRNKMNKNVIAAFAAACGLFMVSCDTPKDLRPGEKVSTEMVEPGTRSTFNVSDAGAPEVTEGGIIQKSKVEHGEIMPDRDLGGNTIQPGDSIMEVTETNTKAGAVRH
jgi:hypothetical protein